MAKKQNSIEESNTATVEYLTIADVARKFKVSRKTVYAWIGRGLITPYKVAGYLIRFSADEVETLITRKVTA